MSRVMFVNRYFYPDHGATSQILTDVAVDTARSGRHVTVITSRLNYSEPDIRYPAIERWEALDIVRVRTTGFGRRTFVGRAMDYLSFYWGSFFSVLKRLERGDTLVVKTDPPLLSIPLGFAARLKRARTINWLQDIYPETASVLGVGIAKGPLGRALKWARNRSLCKASCNVVIGERMARHLGRSGAPQAQTSVIHNFVDDETLAPSPQNGQVLRQQWGYASNDLVIGYSGNLGRAHDIDTILSAAAEVSDDPAIKFLFVGGGHLTPLIAQRTSEFQLQSVAMQAYQPRDRLKHSLSVPDVHWLSLQPSLEGLILPSKLYGAAAVGRPIIMIGDPGGDIGQLIEQYGFGACIRPGDVQGLVAFLRDLNADRDRCRELGQRARAFIETQGSRRLAFDAWRKVLSAQDSN